MHDRQYVTLAVLRDLVEAGSDWLSRWHATIRIAGPDGFAWTDLAKKKARDPGGLSAFIVERAFKGFSSGTLTHKWGILAGNTGFFKMDDVEVPAENLVGREGEGFKIAMFALEQGRYTVAAGATGIIRASRDASVAWLWARM